MKTQRLFLVLCSIFLIIAAGCTSQPTSTPEKTTVATTVATAVPTAVATTVPTAVATATLKPVRIALFTVVLASTYNQASIAGATTTAQNMGATVTVFDANYGASKQVQQVEDAITSKAYDAFMIYPVDGSVITPAVDDAVAAGILVANVGNEVMGPTPDVLKPYKGLSLLAGVPTFEQGTAIGEKIVEECADKNPCKVVYIAGNTATTADQSRLRGIHSILDTHPDIELIATEQASYVQNTAMSVMQNLVLAHPDINVVATSGDQMSIGAALAIADAGLTGKIAVLGLGASKEGIQAIQNGQMVATYALIPNSEAALAAKLLINAVRGTPIVNNTIDVSTLIPPLPAGGPWIDKTNYSNFQPEW